MGRGARFASLLTAAALLAAVSVPAASGAVERPAAAAKKKCKGKGKSAAAKKGKCKKKGPARTPASLSMPSSYDFGVTPVPQTQTARFVVTNKGGSPTGVPSVTLQDNSTVPGALSINSNGCTRAVPGGGACVITVNYFSSVSGMQAQGTLTVAASPGGTVSATITGSA